MTEREALEQLARFLSVTDALAEHLKAGALPSAERFRRAVAEVQRALEHAQAQPLPGGLCPSDEPSPPRESGSTDREILEGLEPLARFLDVTDALLEHLEAEALPGTEPFRQAVVEVQPALRHVQRLVLAAPSGRG